jgi:hypothetical protein
LAHAPGAPAAQLCEAQAKRASSGSSFEVVDIIFGPEVQSLDKAANPIAAERSATSSRLRELDARRRIQTL